VQGSGGGEAVAVYYVDRAEGGSAPVVDDPVAVQMCPGASPVLVQMWAWGGPSPCGATARIRTRIPRVPLTGACAARLKSADLEMRFPNTPSWPRSQGTPEAARYRRLDEHVFSTLSDTRSGS
jgi:hypothetical protein